MARDIAGDIWLDPRVRAFLADDEEGPPEGDVASREVLLAEANSEQARAGAEEFRRFMERFDTEEAAPSAGLRIHTEKVTSQPDGNTINLQVIRPDNDQTLPCVYYIHGGGMGYLSCFDGMFRGWGKLIAAHGVAVVMVDFRNAVVPSSVPEVAPFPAGLNDCVSGLKWVIANAARLGIDPGRVIVAGESGGGNLTLATGLKLKRDGELGLISGLYAMAPFIKGHWPDAGFPVLDSEQRHLHRPARQPGPAARRGRQLLPAAAGGRRPSPVPPGHGHHARGRDVHHGLPGDQPGHGPRPRRLLPGLGRV
jgi:acetyl esterase